MEKNNLKITSPKSLKGIYECAIGNFGVPRYGGTMVGSVIYPNVNQKGCKSFENGDSSFKAKPGSFPTFLLIDRGGMLCNVIYFLNIPGKKEQIEVWSLFTCVVLGGKLELSYCVKLHFVIYLW